MVMPFITNDETSTVAGDATEDGRRPTIVAPPATVSPELLDRPRRRSFTVQDKLRILAEIDGAIGTPGATGAILRREGVYSSTLTDWRRQRDAGRYAGSAPIKRGPKAAAVNPLTAQHVQLLREYKRLKLRLERAEAVIEIQKKVALLLGIHPELDEKL